MGYAIQNITALPFGNIIGGPMKAAIEAQALAAKSTIDFILAVGFQPKSKVVDETTGAVEPVSTTDPFFPAHGGMADVGDVRNVVFEYVVKDAEGNETKATIRVPILTIVPIPFIRIDEMDIDFMAKITEQTSETRKGDESTNFKTGTNVRAGARRWWGSVSVGFNASYSNRHSSSTEASSRYQTEMTMNVHVRAVQDELPAGLSRVLTMLESIIKEDRRALTADEKKELVATGTY